MVQPSNRRLATEAFAAGKQDKATLGADVTADATVRAAFGARSPLPLPTGLVAFWDFTEAAPPYAAKLGRGTFPLGNGAGATVTTVTDTAAPFGSAAVFDGTTDFLTLPGASLGALNLAQIGDTVTVLAWVRRDDTDTGMIAGAWQEDTGDARRQYALFLDLPNYGGDEQVCGHVSASGGPTPGYPFSRDYAASARKIDPATGDYRLVGFTYDGSQAIAYLDGLADSRPTFTDSQSATYAKNPYAFDAGLNRATAVADFTVGANHLSAGMSNFFGGRIGGLAVFDRALTQPEIIKLWLATKGTAPIAWFRFYTPTDGSQGASVAGWRSAATSTAADSSENTALANFIVTRISGNSFLFRSNQGGGAANANTPGFGYYSDIAGLRASQVKSISFRLNNALAADTVRLAVQIGGSWYATDATFSVTGDGRVGADWSTAETKTVTLDRSAGVWRALTFTPGTALSLAGTALGSAIPNGNLTGVGFYNSGDAGVIRIKDVTLNG